MGAVTGQVRVRAELLGVPVFGTFAFAGLAGALAQAGTAALPSRAGVAQAATRQMNSCRTLLGAGFGLTPSNTG